MLLKCFEDLKLRKTGKILKPIKRMIPIISVFRVVPVTFSEEKFYLNKMQSDPHFKGAFGRSLKHITSRNNLSLNSSRFEFCKDIFLTIPVVIYTQKNFYLIDAMDEKIGALKASGLMKLWDSNDVQERFSLENAKESRRLRNLTFYDLTGCFYMLAIGSLVSIVIFVFEFSHSVVVFNVCACKL